MDSPSAAPHRIHCLRALPDPDLAQTPPPLTEPRAPLTETRKITEAVVRLLRDSTGRGPTSASTAIAGSLAVVTLVDCLTKAEKTLAGSGERVVAREMRDAVHRGIRDDAVAVVEKVTGRPVDAYLTAQEFDPDVAILAFYLGR